MPCAAHPCLDALQALTVQHARFLPAARSPYVGESAVRHRGDRTILARLPRADPDRQCRSRTPRGEPSAHRKCVSTYFTACRAESRSDPVGCRPRTRSADIVEPERRPERRESWAGSAAPSVSRIRGAAEEGLGSVGQHTNHPGGKRSQPIERANGACIVDRPCLHAPSRMHRRRDRP